MNTQPLALMHRLLAESRRLWNSSYRYRSDEKERLARISRILYFRYNI